MRVRAGGAHVKVAAQLGAHRLQLCRVLEARAYELEQSGWRRRAQCLLERALLLLGLGLGLGLGLA